MEHPRKSGDGRVSTDKPVNGPDEDQLGFSEFAKHLAISLRTAASPDGFVVSINGAWGSGKTSLLNLIRFYLQEEEEALRPILVQFNPWWFSGQEDLTRSFFDSLQAAVGTNRAAKSLKKLLAGLGALVSHIPDERIAGVGKMLAWFTSTTATVPDLKKQIADLLGRFETPIIVIIDDIDRLAFDEIRQVFRLVKAVGDFPNVIYLLAFDKSVVTKALSTVTAADGDDFLEKIIQVPLELPTPERSTIQRLFTSKLDMIVGQYPTEMFDETHWGNLYLDGIQPLLITPRDVVRLLNALHFTYPAVRSEVNIADFVALEALRVFLPKVYELIRDNPAEFVPEVFSSQKNEKGVNKLLSSALDGAPEALRLVAERIVGRLFPRLRMNYGHDFEASWRRQGRICSPERFPLYFRLSLSKSELSSLEVSQILEASNDADKFADILLTFSEQQLPDGDSRGRLVLDRFQDFTTDVVPLQNIRNIVLALFQVGDRVCRDADTRGPWGLFNNPLRIARIIVQLFRRIPESERFAILSEAIQRGKAVGIIVHEIAIFGQEHGKNGAKEPRPDSERTVTAAHLADLERLALDKLHECASNMSLLPAPMLLIVLNEWKNWAGIQTSEPAEWVKTCVADDNGLVTLLTNLLQTSRSSQLGDRVTKVHYRLDPEWLRSFVDPLPLVERCRNLLTLRQDLTNRQRLALTEFVKEHEAYRSGKNPNDPLFQLLS